MENIKINFVPHSQEVRPEVPKSFYEWFKNNLIVKGFPKVSDTLLEYDVILNVSDEFGEKVFEFCQNNGKQYFWFPMCECNSNIGLNCIYGALKILKLCEEKQLKVLLHCHAGANRSPSVKESYYVMRTHDKFSEEKTPRVFTNIMFGHLPSFYEYYYFLKMVDSENSLDMCIIKNINHK